MKKYMKRLCAFALAMCLTMALGGTALATGNTTGVNAPGTGSSALALNITAATFSVTVPTTLTFNIAADGTVTAPTDCAIVNNGNGPIKITNVQLNAANGWTIKAWADNSFKSTPVNSKIMMVKMNNTAFGTDGAYTGAVKNAVIDGADNLGLTFAADFAEQSAAIEGTIATLVFTIGWNTAG